MRDKGLYERILGIEMPWRVVEVGVDQESEEVRVYIQRGEGERLACPKCSQASPGYDKRERSWRHLDTCQYKTILVAEVPRVRCEEHGVHQVEVPWAEPGSGFTALFEALAIDWLKEASTQGVAQLLGLSWNAMDGIMQRAVKRGLQRRKEEGCQHIGIDEVSFQKRHEYVTVVSDQDKNTVLYVTNERKQASLDGFYEGLSEEQKAGIASVSMDMWPAYINATMVHIPQARRKIAFDRFHVAKGLNEAVDQVRRGEHKAMLGVDDPRLKGSKYLWLRHTNHTTRKQRRALKSLRNVALKTARAWAIKEMAAQLWHYVSRSWAEKGWKRLLKWMFRSRLKPMVKVARTIRRHLWGIINAIVLRVSNSKAESMNSRIQKIKARSHGFRNRERFRNAIYFHLGGLDLYPKTAKNEQ